jgi:hypothetical protein
VGRMMLMMVLSVLAIGLISRGVTSQEATPAINPTVRPLTATPTMLVDEATVQRITILDFPPGHPPLNVDLALRPLGPAIQMRPGETMALALGTVNDTVCDSPRCRIPRSLFIPMPLAADWSVMPADGARIDPATGIMSIDSGTLPGSVFTVRAAVKSRSYEVERQVHIVTP